MSSKESGFFTKTDRREFQHMLTNLSGTFTGVYDAGILREKSLERIESHELEGTEPLEQEIIERIHESSALYSRILRSLVRSEYIKTRTEFVDMTGTLTHWERKILRDALIEHEQETHENLSILIIDSADLDYDQYGTDLVEAFGIDKIYHNEMLIVINTRTQIRDVRFFVGKGLSLRYPKRKITKLTKILQSAPTVHEGLQSLQKYLTQKTPPIEPPTIETIPFSFPVWRQEVTNYYSRALWKRLNLMSQLGDMWKGFKSFFGGSMLALVIPGLFIGMMLMHTDFLLYLSYATLGFIGIFVLFPILIFIGNINTFSPLRRENIEFIYSSLATDIDQDMHDKKIDIENIRNIAKNIATFSDSVDLYVNMGYRVFLMNGSILKYKLSDADKAWFADLIAEFNKKIRIWIVHHESELRSFQLAVENQKNTSSDESAEKTLELISEQLQMQQRNLQKV